MSPLEVLKLIVSNLETLGIAYMVVGCLRAPLTVSLAPPSAGTSSWMSNEEHIDRFLEAFQRDFYVDRQQVQAAVRARRSFNVIHLQSFFKADLFVLGHAAFAREEFARRRLWNLRGEAEGWTYMATAEDTVLSKLAWYRQGG